MQTRTERQPSPRTGQRAAFVKSPTNNERWRGCGERGSLLHGRTEIDSNQEGGLSGVIKQVKRENEVGRFEPQNRKRNPKSIEDLMRARLLSTSWAKYRQSEFSH